MNIKVLLAFVVGVVVASGVAFYAVRKNQAVTPAQLVSSAAAPAATATPLVPEQAAQPVQQLPHAPAPVDTKPSPAVTAKPHRPAQQVAKNQAPPEPAPAPAANTNPAPALPAQAVPPPQEPAPVTQSAPAPQGNEAPPPPPRQAQTVTIPAGTLINVRLGEGLSSDHNAPGDSFSATLDQPLVVDGFVLAERGAKAEGRVVEARRAGRVQGVSDLAIELVRLTASDGQKIRVQTESFTKQGDKEVGKDVAKVGAAAGIGAAIGAIAGGGKGAAIGAAVGGAAGAGGVMTTRGKPAELRVETRLSFRLRDAVTVTEKLR